MNLLSVSKSLFKFKVVHRKYFRKLFWSYLEVKTECFEPLKWKCQFWDFCKQLSGKVETVFWESKTRHSKLFKSKFGSRKHFRKWFGSYLVLKLWKCHFLVFCKFLSKEVGKVRQSIKNCLNQNLLIGTFLEMVSKLPWTQEPILWSFENSIFSNLQVFDWRSWNHFLGKWGKMFKTI